jgi:hypothetical protein
VLGKVGKVELGQRPNPSAHVVGGQGDPPYSKQGADRIDPSRRTCIISIRWLLSAIGHASRAIMSMHHNPQAR